MCYSILNLLDLFRTADERLYFEIDGHWNETVDHRILLRILENLGIEGVALDWFKSYLGNRRVSTIHSYIS